MGEMSLRKPASRGDCSVEREPQHVCGWRAGGSREGDEGEQADEHEWHSAHARAEQLGGDLEHACGEGHTRAGMRRHVLWRCPRHDSAHATTAWYSDACGEGDERAHEAADDHAPLGVVPGDDRAAHLLPRPGRQA